MATVQVGDLEKDTNETLEFMCSVCNRNYKISRAELFCSDCHDYYCNICVKCHDDIPALKKHRILNKAELHAGSGDTFPALASVNDNTESQPEASCPDSLTPVTKIQSNQSLQDNQSEMSLLQTNGKKIYRVRVKSDQKTCHIFSACTLKDGTVILADYNNWKLKRLHRYKYTVIDCCDLPERAWQVCAVSDNLVAVCCGIIQEIHFVAVEATMEKVRKISTNHHCFGLAYADERLYVSTFNSVYMYTLLGDFLHEFASDLTKQKLFLYIECIMVSNDKSKIYVADHNQGFITLDRSGSLVEHVKGSASSLYLHKNGSVLACNRYSRNILQYSPDGKLMGEVLKTEQECLAVCCHKNDSKLIVSFLDSNTIEVYDLTFKHVS